MPPQQSICQRKLPSSTKCPVSFTPFLSHQSYLLGRTDKPEGKLYGQPKIEKSDRLEEFIEMCFDPSTDAHAKLKETLKKMLEEQQGEHK